MTSFCNFSEETMGKNTFLGGAGGLGRNGSKSRNDM